MSCPVCVKEPGSHSLREIRPDVFYTCPAEASKYNDYDGIMTHYRSVLGPVRNPWTWVFDCKGFGLKHLTEVRIATGVAQFVSSHPSLKDIVVVNPSWVVPITLGIVRPFLRKNIRIKTSDTY